MSTGVGEGVLVVVFVGFSVFVGNGVSVDAGGGGFFVDVRVGVLVGLRVLVGVTEGVSVGVSVSVGVRVGVGVGV